MKLKVKDLLAEIKNQIESIQYLEDHPKVAQSTVMHETPEYCRGAKNLLKYLIEYANMNMTVNDFSIGELAGLTKYDFKYRGVICLGVDWEMKLFRFQKGGSQYMWMQIDDARFTADTDHIRWVIENEFAPKKGVILDD